MPGLPTITCHLDDATNSGTWPSNITGRVDLDDGYSIVRGGQIGQDGIQPWELTLTLDNRDGALTRGGSLSTFRAQRLRLIETVGGVSRTFIGVVRGWPVKVQGGPAVAAYCEITVMDRQPRLTRQKMRGLIRQAVLALNPSAYWPLDEPSTATQGSNVAPGSTAGAMATDSTVASGAPTSPLVFGGSAGVGLETSLAPNVGYGSASGVGIPALPYSLSFYVKPSAAGYLNFNSTPGNKSLRTPNGLGVGFQASSGAGVAVAVAADTWIHVACVVTPGTQRVFVGGVDQGTLAAAVGLDSVALLLEPDSVRLRVAIAHLAAFPIALSAAQVTTLSVAAGFGFSGETSASRVSRIASWANIGTADVVTETPALQATQTQTIVDTSPIDALTAVARAEGGLVFFRTDGKLVMQNRYHRAVQTTPVASFTTSDLTNADEFEVDDDDEYLLNTVTGSRHTIDGTTDAPTLISTDAASVALNGEYPADFSDLLVMTDQQAQDAIDWERNTHAAPGPYISNLQFDALTNTTANQQALLNLEISDRIGFGTLPTQLPGPGDLIVEGITEKVSRKEWSYSLNCSPWSLEQAWVLENATYGVLESTTRAGY